MLKSIVEKKNVDGLLSFDALALGETVFADPESNAALQPKFHQFDFIAGSAGAAIATAENRHALPFGKKLCGEPDHQGSFPGAAHGQIANADNCGLQALLLEPAFLVHPDPRADSSTIKQRERPKKSAQEWVEVHRPAPFRCMAILARALSVAPRLPS